MIVTLRRFLLTTASLTAASLPTACGSENGTSAPEPSTNETGMTAGETEAAPLKRHNPEEAAALLESDPSIKILDVRTQEEWDNEGHLEGAILVDYKSPDFKTEVAKLDRDQAWLIHCAAGGRSIRSVTVMEELGFKNLHHLDDGFRGWVAAGLPVEK